jgi:hypothetical protein
MGNVSPRQSKSYHDGLNNHLSLSSSTAATTSPNRSSWKKQLQIINDTLNIKKFSLRHTHGRSKRYRTTFDDHKLSTSVTTQNFHDLMKNNCEKSHKDEHISKKLQQENSGRQMNFKKSFSLFSIKQPLTDSTNKEILTKSINTTINPIKEKEEQEQEQSLSNSITKTSNNINSQENQTADALIQCKRRHRFEMTTGEYDKCTSLQLTFS